MIHTDNEGDDMDDHREQRGWKFSRTLSLDSLLAVGAAAFAVIFFGTTLDKRLSLMESKYDDLVKVIDRNEANQKERSNRLEETVKEQSRQIQQLLPGPSRR